MEDAGRSLCYPGRVSQEYWLRSADSVWRGEVLRSPSCLLPLASPPHSQLLASADTVSSDTASQRRRWWPSSLPAASRPSFRPPGNG